MHKSKGVFLSVLSFGVAVALVPSVTQAQSLQGSVTAVNTAKTVAAPMLLKQAKSDFHQQIADERAQMKQQIQQARSEFQQKLLLIKDQKKQQQVTNINDHIQTMNQNETDKMSQALDSLQTILRKIESQRDVLVSKDANVTTLNADITAATTAIAAAQDAVSTQASKTYPISIVSDATLKTTVGTTVSQFRADMTTTYKSVVNAKQAVVKAAQELKTVNAAVGVNASSSAAVRE